MKKQQKSKSLEAVERERERVTLYLRREPKSQIEWIKKENREKRC